MAISRYPAQQPAADDQQREQGEDGRFESVGAPVAQAGPLNSPATRPLPGRPDTAIANP